MHEGIPSEWIGHLDILEELTVLVERLAEAAVEPSQTQMSVSTITT